eukprot:scaffold88042_cov63-Phaeocystis_antarctica.AAC.2
MRPAAVPFCTATVNPKPTTSGTHRPVPALETKILGIVVACLPISVVSKQPSHAVYIHHRCIAYMRCKASVHPTVVYTGRLPVQAVVRDPVQVGVAHRAAVRVEFVGADLHPTSRTEELVVTCGGRREAAHRHKPVRVGGLGRVAADLDRVAQPGRRPEVGAASRDREVGILPGQA